jgi:hypothetical protein
MEAEGIVYEIVKISEVLNMHIIRVPQVKIHHKNVDFKIINEIKL